MLLLYQLKRTPHIESAYRRGGLGKPPEKNQFYLGQLIQMWGSRVGWTQTFIIHCFYGTFNTRLPKIFGKFTEKLPFSFSGVGFTSLVQLYQIALFSSSFLRGGLPLAVATMQSSQLLSLTFKSFSRLVFHIPWKCIYDNLPRNFHTEIRDMSDRLAKTNL